MMKTVEKSNFPLWSQKAGAPGGRPGRYPEFSRRFSRACRARFSSSLAPTGPSPSRDLPRWGATMDRIRREVLTEVGLGKISNSARTDGRMRRPTTSDLDFENLPARRGPTEGCGESVSRGPLPRLGLRDQRQTTSELDSENFPAGQGRRLRTWESGPGARASGPRDPRAGLRKFSPSARMRGLRADGEDLGSTPGSFPRSGGPTPPGSGGISPGEIPCPLLW